MGVVKGLLAAAEPKITQLGLGLQLDDQTSVHLAVRTLFVPDGKLSQWAKAVKPPQKGLLFGLPAGKYIVAYGGVWPQSSPEFRKLMTWATDSGLSQFGLDRQQRKRYAAISDKQRDQQINSCGMLGNLRPGDSLTGTSLSVEHVKSASEDLKLVRQTFEVLKETKLRGRNGPSRSRSTTSRSAI